MVARSSHSDAIEGRGTDASSLGIPTGAVLAIERGAFFVWPDLDDACYADPAAAAERVALKGWRRGMTVLAAAPLRGTAAVRHLAADVTYLRSLTGLEEPLDALAAYERAFRAAPDFPDAPRALVNGGFAALRLGLAPEAETTFGRVLRDYGRSTYAPIAALGRAMALRRARRWDDARAALGALPDPPPATLRCEVMAERAELARARGEHRAAAALDASTARECPALDAVPGVVAARADSLLALGRRDEARSLLVGGAAGLDGESQADLLQRGGELAREADDTIAARAAFERALGLRIGPVTRAVLQARIARIDAAVGAERALATLDALAGSAATVAARAEIVGIAADTLADLGRYRDAVARLDVPPDTADAVVAPLAARRDAVLGRWIAALAATGDRFGVLAVYGAYRTAIETAAAPPAAVLVAGALADVGLHAAALRLLRLRDESGDPALLVSVAELALGAHESDTARAALGRLRQGDLAPDLAARAARATQRLAIADGALDRVPLDETTAADPVLAGELAAAWIARGDTALASRALATAADAYGRAERAAATADQRVVAAGGLVMAESAGGASAAVVGLAGVADPVVQRGVALVTATRTFGVAGGGARAR